MRNAQQKEELTNETDKTLETYFYHHFQFVAAKQIT